MSALLDRRWMVESEHICVLAYYWIGVDHHPVGMSIHWPTDMKICRFTGKYLGLAYQLQMSTTYW